MAGFLLGTEAINQLRSLIREEAGRLLNPDTGPRAKYQGVEPMWIGKPNADIAKDESGTINLYSGEPGSETILTGRTIPNVWAMTQAVTTDDFVFVFWITGYWYCNLRSC
jgi:hypothetical protein